MFISDKYKSRFLCISKKKIIIFKIYQQKIFAFFYVSITNMFLDFFQNLPITNISPIFLLSMTNILIMLAHLGWPSGIDLGRECAPSQGLRFDYLWCQFKGVSLASLKKKINNVFFIFIDEKYFTHNIFTFH